MKEYCDAYLGNILDQSYAKFDVRKIIQISEPSDDMQKSEHQ